MIEFVIANYLVFVIAAVVLLLGLFGYVIDKLKYKEYRQELINEDKAIDTLESQPEISMVAPSFEIDQENASQK